ncbi:hypothetical protein EYC84_000275 [Monilinia fructicola]|uniref:Uncharacterized protein n=1 Tax=Monilinia fructicola TaxID=38448 RepID=A0A5M9JSR5_MONFR|nr:hypothetical protein EYC84_000275 [Monilinia fructicola]
MPPNNHSMLSQIHIPSVSFHPNYVHGMTDIFKQAGRSSTIDYSSAHNTKAKSPNEYPFESHVRRDGMPKICPMSAMLGEAWNGCQKAIGDM